MQKEISANSQAVCFLVQWLDRLSWYHASAPLSLITWIGAANLAAGRSVDSARRVVGGARGLWKRRWEMQNSSEQWNNLRVHGETGVQYHYIIISISNAGWSNMYSLLDLAMLKAETILRFPHLTDFWWQKHPNISNRCRPDRHFVEACHVSTALDIPRKKQAPHLGTVAKVGPGEGVSAFSSTFSWRSLSSAGCPTMSHRNQPNRNGAQWCLYMSI